MDNNICLKLDLNNIGNITTLYGEQNIISAGDVSAVVLGNLYDRSGNRLDAEGAIRLYCTNGADVNNCYDGMYTVIIIDKSKGKAYVFQDFFGSNLAVYYYRHGDTLYITNSLKAIIRDSGVSRRLNRAVVKQFILRGYSPNEDTLIEGVYKMPGYADLVISAADKSVKLVKRKKEPNPKREITVEEYDRIVTEQCRQVYHPGMAATISSGYDSNYIMHNLQKLTDGRIDAFCIGGTIGTDEIPDAEKICAYYGNVDLHTRRVDGASFDKLPEIVYAMEGCMYERGIFLQYELADLVSSHGVKDIMLGESADQVLNFEMYHPYHQSMSIFRQWRQKFFTRYFKKLYYRPYRTVYEMATYIVTKKNGIMMNYFGVNPEYPYMRKEFMRTAENAVRIGERKKEFHKKAIGQILPREINDIIHKMPGSTELKDLFIGDISYEDILEVCKKSEFYTPRKFDDGFYEIDNYLKITYLIVFKKMFIDQPDKYLTDTYGGYTLKELLFE